MSMIQINQNNLFFIFIFFINQDELIRSIATLSFDNGSEILTIMVIPIYMPGGPCLPNWCMQFCFNPNY